MADWTEEQFIAELIGMWEECIHLGHANSRNEEDDAEESHRSAIEHYDRLMVIFRDMKKAVDQHSGMP